MHLGQHMTEEQRAKDSSVHMGHPVSTEARAKMSASHKGQRAWNKGIPMTDEQKTKSSLAHKGQIASPEARAHMSAAGMGNKKCVGRVPWNKGLPWSPEARAVLSANHADMRRELNPFWKGGVTSENHIIRGSSEYVAWRTAVFERDNYTCQECGAHNGTGHTVVLEAHHLHEFAKYPAERFAVENGKTLCVACHNKTKGRYHKDRVKTTSK